MKVVEFKFESGQKVSTPFGEGIIDDASCYYGVIKYFILFPDKDTTNIWVQEAQIQEVI